MCDIDPVVRDRAEELGELARAEVGDLSDLGVIRHWAESAQAHAGPVDLLISNVGNNPHTEIDAPLEEMAQAFDASVATNLRAAVLLGRAVLPMLRQNGGGHIVNISTDHVHTCGWPDFVSHADAPRCPFGAQPRPPWGGWSWLFVYDITKWGLNGLTNNWSRALADEHIQVNNFCLGTIDSPRVRTHYTPETLPDWADTWMQMDDVVRVLADLIYESPGRSGDNVGLWCGHPPVLPPPGRQALPVLRAAR
jgi:NAD(P)-dependent dehydrogenase (short-subunit alcohol dehydrogenase family)